jgi:hypothetical protein
VGLAWARHPEKKWRGRGVRRARHGGPSLARRRRGGGGRRDAATRTRDRGGEGGPVRETAMWAG